MPGNYTPKHHKGGGYVYLIQMGDTPYHKVGIAISSPQDRISGLQVSSPFDLFLIESYLVRNPVSLERDIHKALAYCRVRGEWFRNTDGDVLRTFHEYGSMALFDTALDVQAPILSRPSILVLMQKPCKKCGAALNPKQYAAAQRWGYCPSCKEVA